MLAHAFNIDTHTFTHTAHALSLIETGISKKPKRGLDSCNPNLLYVLNGLVIRGSLHIEAIYSVTKPHIGTPIKDHVFTYHTNPIATAKTLLTPHYVHVVCEGKAKECSLHCIKLLKGWV